MYWSEEFQTFDVRWEDESLYLFCLRSGTCFLEPPRPTGMPTITTP
jgi:hypothetical protein